MEAAAVVILIGVIVYFFLKSNTQRGTNAVRAYLYLRAINDGASTTEANRIAQADIVAGSTQIIREAQQYVRSAYGGKQLPMIEEARRRGLALSGSGQAASKHRQHPLASRQQDWVTSFVLYYVASEMSLVGFAGHE